LLNINQATIEPFVRPHRITGGVRLYKSQDQGFKLGVFFSAAF
jgi:hypothetical protein